MSLDVNDSDLKRFLSYLTAGVRERFPQALETTRSLLQAAELPGPQAVANIVSEFGMENLQPGDVLVCNDPYRKGTHISDNAFIRPVFHNGKIVAFVTLLAHLLDMGGTVPAGFSGSKRNIYTTENVQHTDQKNC